MKKIYMTPALMAQQVLTGGLIALSLMEGKATGDDALIKGSNDWENIWSDEAFDESEQT